MQLDLKTNTENFLHTNPAFYFAFYRDNELTMARFIHQLLVQYNVGKKILDIGSGLGREVAYLNSIGYEAIGIDNSPEMLEWSNNHYPESTFLYGNQSDFSIDQKFDALYCIGSTFLYNLSNESILDSLKCFRKHLHAEGLLYLDMRNAAFFLTSEGQRWLKEELTEETNINNSVVTLKTRFSINPVNQLLERNYCWHVTGKEPISEHLKHRLIFPQELISYLTSCGFRILEIFDHPAPHIYKYDASKPLVFKNEMLGTRMQIIAQAI